MGDTELQESIKGFFSIVLFKISIEIEAEGVKLLSEILNFSIEIKFSGYTFSVNCGDWQDCWPC